MTTKQLSHYDQIASISKRVTILNSEEFKIDDQKQSFYNQQPHTEFFSDFKNFGENREQNNQSNKNNFIQFLASVLYSKFYCGINDLTSQTLLPSKQERDNFMQQLSEANTSTNGYDYYWQVNSIDQTGNLTVSKNGETRYQQPNSYIPADKSSTKQMLNSFVHIIRQKEHRELQPVFYYAFGDELVAQQLEMVRIYFNLVPEGAAKLISQITTLFNNYKVPFSFKCLNHPDLYNRNDSAVLYIDKSHLNISTLLLKEVIESIKPFLKEETPWFTHQLYKGISYAEDPGKGQSFGMNRCTLLSNALWQAYKSGIINPEDKLNFIVQHLQSNGLQLEHPYLNTHTSIVPSFPQF